MTEQETQPMLPCHWCRRATPRSQLAEFGARCTRCYEAYLKGEPPPRTLFEPQGEIA